MNTKLLSYISPISSVLTLILVTFLVFSPSSLKLGGTTNYDTLDVSDGYYVDGSVVINGSGVLTGVITSANAVTLSGITRIFSPVITGATSTLSGTTTTVATAAQVKANIILNISPSITAASTFNLPTTQAMFADSLTTNGDNITFFVRNLTASTTVVTAGNASTTILYDGATGGSATLAASSWAKITLLRATDQLMLAIMNQFKP